MKEFDFIRGFLHTDPDPDILLGIGDDAAIVRAAPDQEWCISKDMLLAGRHFFADDDPADIACKVLAVNLSDLAAMGARPRWLLLGAALPELDPNWLTAFTGSLSTLCRQYGISLIGGDTTRGALAFSATVIGHTPPQQALRRSGAQAGDDIWVSGRIGLAAAGLQHRLGRLTLPPEAAAQCLNALNRPTPRVALGMALRGLVHAAQDVSDGLAQDLQHILTASAVGADLEFDRIPTLEAVRRLDSADYRAAVLAGGDDYELLFTAAPEQAAAVEAAARRCAVTVSRIGRIRAGSGLNITDAGGRPIALHRTGFDHFD